MKERTKTQKGITLIALIITIVVLMILAAVAINSITNDGIMGQAQSVKNTYTEKVNEEQKMLDYYQLVLEQKAWIQNGTTVSRNGQTLNVGEAVKIKVGEELKTYKELGYDGENATYSGEWVVLGAEYGKLLLVSATNVVASVPLGGIKGGNVNGKECVGGYNNGAAAIDTVCSAYLNKTFADSARSITVEDINRVTGYVPGVGTTYTYTSNFIHPDGREIGKNGVESITETSTSYKYQGKTYITDTTDPAYVALFNNTGMNTGGYWLASTFMYDSSGYAYFGLFMVCNGQVSPRDMCVSFGGQSSHDFLGARAVVSLRSDVQVAKT